MDVCILTLEYDGMLAGLLQIPYDDIRVNGTSGEISEIITHYIIRCALGVDKVLL